jgi:hypothetical protein
MGKGMAFGAAEMLRRSAHEWTSTRSFPEFVFLPCKIKEATGSFWGTSAFEKETEFPIWNYLQHYGGTPIPMADSDPSSLESRFSSSSVGIACLSKRNLPKCLFFTSNHKMERRSILIRALHFLLF